MSSPFANGSAFARPVTARPIAPPAPAQLEEQYTRQIYANQTRAETDLQNAIERERLATRGRELAGFVQVDRRAEQLGFQWIQRHAPAWPAQMPAPAIAAVERAITADRTSRAALSSAEQSYHLWAQQHPTASDELRRVKYEESTIDQLAVAQKAAQNLDAVLVDAAALVETIEEWRHVEDTAGARRSAAERQYRATLDKVETELMLSRQAVSRLGVKV